MNNFYMYIKNNNSITYGFLYCDQNKIIFYYEKAAFYLITHTQTNLTGRMKINCTARRN